MNLTQIILVLSFGVPLLLIISLVLADHLLNASSTKDAVVRRQNHRGHTCPHCSNVHGLT